MGNLLLTLLLLMLFGPFVANLICFAIHYYDVTAIRGRPAPNAETYASGFVREWLWCVASLVAHPWGFVPRGDSPVQPGGGPPILLVHGYMMNHGGTLALQWRLKRAGLDNIARANLRPMFGPIEEMAKGLSAQIRAMAESHGAPVSLVCHSLGGVVARWALHTDPELPVAKLVTLASPHLGTNMAHFARLPAARQVLPNSPFLASMPELPRVPTVALYSRLDQVLIPYDNGVFGHRQIALDHLGHVSLLYDAQVAETVAQELAPAAVAATESQGS